MAEKLTTHVEGLELQASLFRPTANNKKVTLFCLPGGGLTKDYFDLAEGFSFARSMSAKGYAVITMDHPSVATNSTPEDHPYLTPRIAAEYLSKALTSWTGDDPIIGVGHSMGGMMIMLMQGNHAPFSALGLFGSNAGGLDWGLSDEEKPYINKEAKFEQDIKQLSFAKFGGPYTQVSGGPSGTSILFGGGTPELNQRLRDISCEMNSTSALMSMVRGSFKTEVEAINVPMFFAFGDHNIGIPPEEAPKDFINAKSSELIILENTGHNHFAFTSIETFCAKFDYWASNLD
ncbi:alpha/beta hydrolase [Hellea sp.]|nr:alpha/beta hydrolase [Hellea sp.]